jgi:hypothetical protein
MGPRHESELDINCRKQFAQLCYQLLIAGKIKSNSTPELRVLVIKSLGSDQEKEKAFRRFNMIDDLIELYQEQKRYRGAYELGVNIGHLESSFQLLLDRELLDWAPQAQLKEVLNNIHAGRFLDYISGGREWVQWSPISATSVNDQISSVNHAWDTMAEVINTYVQSRIEPPKSHFQYDPRMQGFLDIIVR